MNCYFEAGELVRSLLWREPSDVRVTWLTMVALADPDGTVHQSAGAIAGWAGLPTAIVRDAIAWLLSDAAPEGIRIRPEGAGWRLHEPTRAAVPSEAIGSLPAVATPPVASGALALAHADAVGETHVSAAADGAAEPEKPAVPATTGEDSNALAAWLTVAAEIRPSMREEVFDATIARCRGAALANGVLRVRAPDQRTLDVLLARQRQIEAILIDQGVASGVVFVGVPA